MTSTFLQELSAIVWLFLIRLVLPLVILFAAGWLVWRFFAPKEAAERRVPFSRFVFKVREFPAITVPDLSARAIFTLMVIGLLWIAAAGFIIARMFFGLGAATALSDTVPWGLWIAFKLSCVAVAAGGFTFAAVVYVFRLEQFRPLVRSAILIALLGYSTFIVSLMFDLGRWYNIWHPIIMWNPHSVMFEVAWCVMLYTAVLLMEFSPAVLERFHLVKAERVLHKITPVLVILGVILSTLHQSSLGSLYLILPTKLNAFWHSPLLPVFFFTSAVAAGLAMMIFVSTLGIRYFGLRKVDHLLASLCKPASIVLGIYLALKLVDYALRGVLVRMTTLNFSSSLLWAELLIGVVIPMALFWSPAAQNSRNFRFWTAVLVIVGTVLNRSNVALFGFFDYYAARGVNYVPSVGEWTITLGLLTFAIAVYIAAVKLLPILPKPAEGAV